MELSKEIADRLGVIEGTVTIITIVDVRFIPANPSGKGVQISYRRHAGDNYPEGIPCTGVLVPIECFAGHDPSGYVDAYLSLIGRK